MDLGLKGLNVLISGGSKGIGLGIALGCLLAGFAGRGSRRWTVIGAWLLVTTLRFNKFRIGTCRRLRAPVRCARRSTTC